MGVVLNAFNVRSADGIQLFGYDSVVEEVHAFSNAGTTVQSAGIFVQDGTVARCTAAVNAGSGIEAPAEVVISFSSVSDNGLDGIDGGGVASNDASFRNGRNGISGAGLAINNFVYENLKVGITGGPGTGTWAMCC